MTRTGIALGALAYAALVAHLLFIPYSTWALPFDEALSRFEQIPWMHLGSDQNIALVSRALMFAPLGLLLAASVAPQPTRQIELGALLSACIFGSAWAVAVNFAQLWFPTRTVSLNNLAAEAFGVIVGGLLWSTLGATWLRWRRQLAAGGHFSLSAALSGYALLYLVASLTPFDFVTNASELAEKASSNLYGLWIAPVGCGPAPCTLKFVTALFAAVPCGWWFAAWRRNTGSVWPSALLVAFAVATLIELLHFLMVSGVSQGLSVLMRASGMLLGVATYSWRYRFATFDLNLIGRPLVVALIVPYLMAVAYVGGWFRAPRLGVEVGLARLSDVVWLPFFYQYYAPYTSSMYSAMIHAALYAPVGVMCWLWTRHRARIDLWVATVLGVLLAFAAETSKVFLADRLPDYTDVFIAAISATLVLAILRFASRSPKVPKFAAGGASLDTPRLAGETRDPEQSVADAIPARAGARLTGLLLLGAAALTVIGFPVGSWALGLALLVYAALLLRFPTFAYLVAIPMLLPVLDLASFSGRFFWDEFDALLSTTLGVRLIVALPEVKARIPVPKAALWLLFASVLASTAIGLWPPAPVDANAFTSYLSPYNALRVAKGYVWSFAILWLMWRDASAGREVAQPLRIGLAMGLLAVTISVFWERLLFVGEPDLGTVFRAAGLVSATHVGGAYLEAMLVMLTPFGLALAVSSERPGYRIFWYAVALLGGGAVLATLSRAAIFAWLISVALFATVWWLKSRNRHAVFVPAGWRWGAGAALVGLLVVTVFAATSTQLPQRLTTVSPDFSVRAAHWKETVNLMHRDPLHAFLGMGLGSFPREYYLVHAWSDRLPGYRLERDARTGWSYLMLTGGRGMYIDQRVDAQPGRELRLSGELRSSRPGSGLSISLCEKSSLNSIRCDNESVIAAGPTWQPFELRLFLPPEAQSRLAPLPSIALSLHNEAFGSRVEVTHLSLVGAQTELLRNASFENGLDRWFMTSDEHLAWRVKSTPLQIAFEQGLFGILAWAVLAVAVVAIVLRPSAAPVGIAAYAAALVGFVAVGSFDSLLDSPRLILLLALIGGTELGSVIAQRSSSRAPTTASTTAMAPRT